MSWLFSQALAEEYSAGTCLDGQPFAPLNVMPTQHKFSRHDKMIEASNLSRFGLTCAVLTESHGEELLMWYLAGFHAKTSVVPDQDKALMETDQDYGHKWPGSFVRLCRNTSLWKTRQYSLLGDLESFCQTWPRWGSMQDGECLALAPMVHHIHVRDCSWWPTPVATDHKRGKGSKAHRLANGRAVIDRPSKCRYGATIVDILGGTPNPEWIEWLMGWPTNWTALNPLETAKFRSWQQQHLII